MKQELAYFIHDCLKVEHSTSIQKIGELDVSDLSSLLAHFPICEPIGWRFVEKDENSGYSKSIGIDPAIFARDDFLEFNVDENCVEFENYFNEHYSLIAQEEVTVMFCSGSYAQLHSDSNSIKSRGQLMFILSNDSQHTFISIDDNGITHELTPVAGDIILLDIACRHALLPKNTDINALNTIKPLQMAMVSMNDF